MYRLRKLDKKDIRYMSQWLDGTELLTTLGYACHFNNSNTNMEWYVSQLENRGDAIRCAVVEDGSDDIFGMASLVSIDFMNQSAELRIMISAPEYQRAELEIFAVNAMLNHAFTNMNLQRVELLVPESNKWKIQLYDACGLKYEGRKRKAMYSEGAFSDILIYSALREEYVFTLGDNNVYGLPGFCIEVMETKACIDKVIRACDDAFYSPVGRRDNYKELLEKFVSSATFICAHNSEILGYAAFYSNDYKNKTAYISLIAVRPEFQGLHIGTAILNTCQDIARNHGMNRILLEVDNDNKKGIAFYRRYGFFSVVENDKILMRKDF